MKLQSLTVIFVILIMPVTLILSAYIGAQIDTASLQQSYDTKLMDATHDAVMAFELNTNNDAYSNTADSVRRDIIAAINTFTTSLASGLNIPGANTEYIMPYIPAILITMYDGYYIYSPSENRYIGTEGDTKTGYAHILKPYVYYSAKYVSGSDYAVINYSLDNYITIYGVVGGKVISKSGYLETTDYLDNILDGENLSEIITYKISDGNNTTTITTPNRITFKYYNGKKIYRINNNWYYLNDLELLKVDIVDNDLQDHSARKYKDSAIEFNNWLKTNEGRSIVNLVTPNNARDINGNPYSEFAGNTTKILETDAEDYSSAFNQHKREVIKKSIQDDLNNAIALYNRNSGAMGVSATNFTMPKLSELDWEKVITNVNFVTFMQGLPLGNKIYNNYSIVTTTNNKQYISKESIYLVDAYNNAYHTYAHALAEADKLGNLVGYKSADFERVKYEGKKNGEDAYLYYYRRPEYGDYDCIVEPFLQTQESSNSAKVNAVKQSYYTALARERYNLDKVTKLLINYEN